MRHIGKILLICIVSVTSARGELPFKVRPDRPRMFVRADDWAGPSVPKLRRFYKLPEYEQRGINATQPDGSKNWVLLHWLAGYGMTVRTYLPSCV